MNDANQQLALLEENIQALLRLLAEKEKETHSLEEKVKSLEIIKLRLESELEERVHRTRSEILGAAASLTRDSKIEARRYLNKRIRELDRCISLLST